MIQIFEQITFEIILDCSSQVVRIAWSTKKTCYTLYHLISERSNICCDHRQAEVISQKDYSALKDVCVRQYQQIRGFEIQLRLGIRDVLNFTDNTVVIDVTLYSPQDLLKVLLGPFP